jgi:hypothetical protein
MNGPMTQEAVNLSNDFRSNENGILGLSSNFRLR